MITLASDNKLIEEAFRTANDDMRGNVKPYKAGLLKQKRGCLMAGHDYDTPWTRDTAFNVYNAMALTDRTVARDTLLSVLERRADKKIYIGGEYWDCIIWAFGAMQYIEITNDRDFIKTAYEAVTNSLAFFEETEFDPDKGLFRGPAVYGDGVAAYPDKYSNAHSSGIKFWQLQEENKDKIAPVGVGLPMFCLSTNCVYYRAYEVAAVLAKMQNKSAANYTKKAKALKENINKHFYNESRQSYDYMAYECDGQEALGDAFAILFDIADKDKKASMLKSHHVCPHGTPCVWPNFNRYAALGGYGRHAGTIWPHAQGYWGMAAFFAGDKAAFTNELTLMAQKAVQNGQFHEIYHPDDGRVYGGLQEFDDMHIGEWGSCSHQTWSATTYLAMVYYCILGMKPSFGEVTFTPYLPDGVNEISLKNLHIGAAVFNITVRRGKGRRKAEFDTTQKARHAVTLHV